VAHAYNPSYSGGRDQEDRGLKPAGANSSRDLISGKKKKKCFTKKVWWSVSNCRPELKPQHQEKKSCFKMFRIVYILYEYQEEEKYTKCIQDYKCFK
jgi:hypothetical protein